MSQIPLSDFEPIYSELNELCILKAETLMY